MNSQNTGMESKSGCAFEYVKRVALSAPGKFLFAVAVLIGLVSSPLLSRANDRHGHDRNEKRTLTGNWIVTVTRFNPAPGLAPTFLSLMTFFEDGNSLEESNTSAIRSIAHGKWERIGHQQFSRVSVSFRFDGTRTYLGTSRLTATVTLSEDGSEFHADAVIQQFDPSGNLVSTIQAPGTEFGQRLF